MVDEPRAAMPHEQVRVARRSGRCWSRARRTRRRGRELRVGWRVDPGAVGQRAGQEVEADVEPALRSSRSRISWSGSALAMAASMARRARCPGPAGPAPADAPGDQLCDERLGSLAGARELDHVQPVVVRLHDRGQRAALAQGRHVPRDGHRTKHAVSATSRGSGRSAPGAGRPRSRGGGCAAPPTLPAPGRPGCSHRPRTHRRARRWARWRTPLGSP